ncbi:MAG: hypothetical protein ACAH80_02550 [Alphaproteobacteria bacterium]
MKASSKVAAGAGALAAGIGIVCAFLCPLAGLAAGAYLTYGAVAATMGTAATVALTAAGAVGGLLLGRITAPVVAIASIGLGAAVGLGVKMIGVGLEKLRGSDKPQQAPAQKFMAIEPASNFNVLSTLKAAFGKAQEPSNDNVKPAPQLKMLPKAPGL